MVPVATTAEIQEEAAWRPGDRAQLAVVTVSHAVQHVYPAALAIAYPFVVGAFHISYGTLGVVLAASGVVGGLLQGAAGMFERASARLLLGGQNLALALATVLAAVAPSFGLFGLARLVGALASWPQHPVGSAVLARRFPKRRAYALSWHVAGGSIGTALVPLAASGLIASLGWRVGLGLFALPCALGALAVGALLRDPAAAPPHGGPPGIEAAPAQAPPVALRSLLRRREVLGALAAGTIAAGGRGLGALTTYVPAYLRSDLHLSTLAVGAVFTVVVLGSIAGPLVAGNVADRVGRRGVLVVVYLLGAGAITGFVFVGSGLAALAAVGFGVGVLAYAESPLLQAVFSEAAHGSADRAAFGLYFAIAYGVGALWLAVTGIVIDRWGFRAAFVVMAASFVVAGLVVALAGPDRTPAGRAGEGR